MAVRSFVRYSDHSYTIEDDLSTKDDAAKVAHAIRQRRDQLGLSIRDLATRSGVSPSMISDIERQVKSPTISTLSSLAAALAVPTSALVEGATGEGARWRMVRAAECSRTTDPKSGVARESFGPRIKGSNVEFLRLVIPPSSIAGPFPPHPRGTIEHVYVASGSIRLLLGQETLTLGGGDFCTCLADAPHSFDNRTGEREALLYVVVEPT